MGEYFHSVTLNSNLCKGCTNCIKSCPTQAIRVQNGKAKIIKERCIDCGACIRVCPYRAKDAITEKIDALKDYEYNIALPAPAFYGQFSKADHIDMILTGLKQIGFDHVFEVAMGAEIVTEETKKLIKEGKLLKPAISSACPAVLRLIAVRFPNIIDHLVPLMSPMEVAARLAREEAEERTGLSKEKIGVFFISPCAAKETAVHNPLGNKESNVSGVLSIKDVYLHLAHRIGKIENVEPLSTAGAFGVRWAEGGGEASALSEDNSISVDGIENCIRVLEDIEDEKLSDILFVEALACPGGCVGGPLTVENSFVARSRIRKLAKALTPPEGKNDYKNRDMDIGWDSEIEYRSVMNLDDDVVRAMQKLQLMDEINQRLPQLDCGSCGAPACRALAEDIVRGFAQETDCIFKLRERVRTLAKEMMDLEETMPPSFYNNSQDEQERRR